jgi:hypothetical protein
MAEAVTNLFIVEAGPGAGAADAPAEFVDAAGEVPFRVEAAPAAPAGTGRVVRPADGLSGIPHLKPQPIDQRAAPGPGALRMHGVFS